MVFVKCEGNPKTDRLHCFKSGSIAKSRRWPDSPQRCDSLMILKTSNDTQDLFEQKYFAGSMPLLTPITVLWHLYLNFF